MEWSPNRIKYQPENKTALIQLCGKKTIARKDSLIVLFLLTIRLYDTSSCSVPSLSHAWFVSQLRSGCLDLTLKIEFPSPLKDLLEDDKIIKTGLNVHGDAMKLNRYRRPLLPSDIPDSSSDFNIILRNYVELNTFCRPVIDLSGKKYVSLAGLCEILVLISATSFQATQSD